MNLYNITNRTSAQNLGLYPGRTADEALDAFYSDAGYSCRVGAACALDTTVEALLADLIVEQYDYADDLETLAAAMVDDDRTSGECTADVLDDPDAGGSDHWDWLGIIVAAERIGISRGTVCAMGLVAIRDAYAAAWRAAVVSQRTLYGIRNVVFYADPREAPRYYLTRKTRDAALASLRDLAVSRGLSADAARAGIYPVKRLVRDVSRAESLIDSAAENERALAAHVEVAS